MANQEKSQSREMTKVVALRYDPSKWEKPTGIYYPRYDARPFRREILTVRDSPQAVLENLFPYYRIFGFREIEFRDLACNSKRYSGLILEAIPADLRIETTTEDLGLPRSLKAVKRKPSNTEFPRLSSEAIEIVDLIANWSANAFFTNSQKYRALGEVLQALKPYLETPKAHSCINKAAKFIVEQNSLCAR